MKDIYWKISNLIILLFGIAVITLGTFYKHISFGMGLGDLVGYFFMYLIVIIHSIMTWVKRKRINSIIAMTIVFAIIWFFIVIKATVGRGAEYRWNGKIFYGYKLNSKSSNFISADRKAL